MLEEDCYKRFFPASQRAFPNIKRKFETIADQSDDLEDFVIQSLKFIGDIAHARFLGLTVRDARRDKQLIYVLTAKKNGHWETTLIDQDLHHQRPCTRRRRRPAFLLRSVFSFQLRLPQRWTAVFQISYPGIRILSESQYCELCHFLSDLSDSLHVVLLNRELVEVEHRLIDEEMANCNLRKFMSNLSKELYCLSSVSTVLGQTHDIEDILTRVFETTLPLLRAQYGTIFLPEKDQCLSFQSDRSTYTRLIHDHHLPLTNTYSQNGLTADQICLKSYFESRLGHINNQPNRIILQGRSIFDPMLPPQLKNHFDQLKLQSCFEFSLQSRNEFFGLGLIGFKDKYIHSKNMRLFLITLNMTGLFLENISLMRDLEHQIKMKSMEMLEMEKRQKFLLDRMDQKLSVPSNGSASTRKWLLDEIEHTRKMALLGELASGVAHQIRNPLNNLMGALHLMQQDDTSETEKSELIAQMSGRVQTINRMINEFIQYTRIPELNLTVEHINETIENTLKSFKGWFELARVELITSFDKKLPPIRIDLYLMNQVYHNIIKNALEAIYNNGRLKVTTRKLRNNHPARSSPEFIEIIFQDSGSGIDKNDLLKILTPFFSRKENGLGLGLSVVDHIIRRHGGWIQVKSVKDRGTTITLCVPIR